MGLQHADAVIIVHDEAGQPVPFPVHQAVTGGLFRPVQTERNPKLKGPSEHNFPKVRSGGIRIETEDAHRDGTDLVMAGGEVLPIGGKYADKVPFRRMADDLGDGPGENPGMETEDGILAVRTENDFIHNAIVQEPPRLRSG